jgi:hypothetical protein
MKLSDETLNNNCEQTGYGMASSRSQYSTAHMGSHCGGRDAYQNLHPFAFSTKQCRLRHDNPKCDNKQGDNDTVINTIRNARKVQCPTKNANANNKRQRGVQNVHSCIPPFLAYTHTHTTHAHTHEADSRCVG